MLSDNIAVLIYYRNLLQNEPEMNSVNTVKFLARIAQTRESQTADHTEPFVYAAIHCRCTI